MHLVNRNSAAAMVLSATDHNRLCRLADRPFDAGSRGPHRLLTPPPAAEGRIRRVQSPVCGLALLP